MSPLPFNSPFATKTGPSVQDTAKPAGKGPTADDVEDLLNTVDDEVKPEIKLEVKPETKEDKEEEDGDKEENEEDNKEDEEEDDEVELKENEDEEDDEKLDLKESKEEEDEKLVTPPRVGEIEKKFPGFFEAFPFMKRMMFRDKAMTEMFGSFDEAKEVYGKVERLNEFETQLLGGDIKEILSAVKEADSKSFDKIVDTLLKQIADVDKSAYDDITQNFAKQIVMGIADEAKRKGNKELDKLAKDLHEWLFDTDQWQDFKVRVKAEKSEAETKVETERQELMRERFETARDSLSTKVDNILKATISEYIDPRGQMSNYEKKTAVADALKALHSKVGEDTVFRKNLNRLWRAALNEKFSENSLNGIKKSYLGKAKGLITSVIRDVRGEVLKDNRSRGREKEEEKEETRPKMTKNVNAGRPHQQTTKANERRKDETVAEFFDRD